jgi:RimJ/RimL family protein N-acetyltransferase
VPAVRLEIFTERHLPGLAALAGDPDVLRFTRFPDPPEDAFPRQWLARYEAGRRAGTREAFAAVAEDDGRFLGLALAPEIDAEARQAELGYVVAPEQRGQGYGGELLRQLTAWAFDELALLRVTLLIDAANGGSLTVAERAGYVREGVQRNAYVKPGLRSDVVVYSRLPTDPPPPPTAASGAPQDSRSAGGGTL